MSDEVDDWMSRYQNPQKPLVQAVRKVILNADKRMDECVKWQAPTFVYKGNLASFYLKAKAHVSVMFHTGAKIIGDFPSLEGDGATARVLKIADAADLKAKSAEIKRIVQAWCDQQDAS